MAWRDASDIHHVAWVPEALMVRWYGHANCIRSLRWFLIFVGEIYVRHRHSLLPGSPSGSSLLARSVGASSTKLSHIRTRAWEFSRIFNFWTLTFDLFPPELGSLKRPEGPTLRLILRVPSRPWITGPHGTGPRDAAARPVRRSARLRSSSSLRNLSAYLEPREGPGGTTGVGA